MTYIDAITYLVNSGFAYKAIRELSECAEILADDIQREAVELKAEKRTIKKFLNSNMDNENKVDAISALVSEETNE